MSKTSDKDSKIIEKEDKDDLFNEINASLLDEGSNFSLLDTESIFWKPKALELRKIKG